MFYHGSSAVFKEFDKKRIGQNYTYSEGSGFFFTKKKSSAEGWAGTIDKPGFIFEVALRYQNPVKRKTRDSDFYAPADYFDLHSDDMLREAYLEGKDAIVIEGTRDDDVVVVFEPDQIEILKIFENDVEIYDRDAPEKTKYPEILGLGVESDINKESVPFHHDAIAEYLEEHFTSIEFGDRLDEQAKKALNQADMYQSDDGRHFGRGADFAKMALSLFCESAPEGGGIYCREDCVVIHDFDNDMTLIHDTQQSGETLGELAQRPLVEVSEALKSFEPEDKEKYPSRKIAQIFGPQSTIEQWCKETVIEGTESLFLIEQRDPASNASPEQERLARAQAQGFDTSKVWYHMTDQKFTAFDIHKSADTCVWLADDPTALINGDHAATGSKYIVPVYIHSDALAGWDEYDSLMLEQLSQEGFDGALLDDVVMLLDPAKMRSVFDDFSLKNDAKSILINPDLKQDPFTLATEYENQSLKRVR